MASPSLPAPVPSSKTSYDSVAPQVTVDGQPVDPQSVRPGGQTAPCDPPASRSQFIGTVQGNAQRKPFNVR